MAAIYVASFVNEYDYDVDVRRDSLGEDTMSDLAHGYTCCVGRDHGSVLAKAKELFIREYAEYQVDEETEENIEQAKSIIESDIEFIASPALYGDRLPTAWSVELFGDVIGSIVIREFDEV